MSREERGGDRQLRNRRLSFFHSRSGDRRMHRRFIPCLAAALLIATAPTVLAQALTGTLKKIKDSGEMTVGYRDSSIPFSYLADGAKPVGYSLELCAHVVDAVKKQLNMPNLKVNMQAVTSQNRIPLVVNGTVTIECG